MHRTTRIVASTLAMAALGVAGAQSGATANQTTNTCTHGVVNNNSGHKSVIYEGFRNSEDAHVHQYRHNAGWIGDHDAERNC